MDLFQLHHRNKENGRTNPVISVSGSTSYILGVNNFSGKGRIRWKGDDYFILLSYELSFHTLSMTQHWKINDRCLLWNRTSFSQQPAELAIDCGLPKGGHFTPLITL